MRSASLDVLLSLTNQLCTHGLAEDIHVGYKLIHFKKHIKRKLTWKAHEERNGASPGRAPTWQPEDLTTMVIKEFFLENL